MINAALIGMGWWGKNIAQSIQHKSQLINFKLGVTKEINETQDFAKKMSMQLSDSFEFALAQDDIQAVVLATPHSLHAEQIIAAANAGKHVFCEKPLAISAAPPGSVVKYCTLKDITVTNTLQSFFQTGVNPLRNHLQAD